MEEQIIVLSDKDYGKLIEITENGCERINFGCIATNKLLTINIKNAKSNSNNKNNIVAKWMQAIVDLAIQGYERTSDNDSSKIFLAITAYCDGVITSVTT